MIESYILLGTLGVHSIEDMKRKEITVTVTLFSGILGVFLHIFFQDKSIFAMLAGTIPGFLLLFLSYLTKGAIGAGDGIVFMLTGLYLGLAKNLLLMFTAFFLAGLFGIFLLAAGYSKRKSKRKEKIPLVPFLFLGYILLIAF